VSLESEFRLTDHAGVPLAARELIWDVFFRSRGRGVTLTYHYPWMDSQDDIRCLTINWIGDVSSPCVATLIIKKMVVAQIGIVGLIGFVCVHRDYRGRKLSAALLDSARSSAERDGMVALLLWTSQPRIYENIGFRVDLVELFGSVCRPAVDAGGADLIETRQSIAVSESHEFGVPAFATATLVYRSRNATLYACRVGTSLSLVQWSGSVSEVIEVIRLAFPTEWQINVAQADPLLDALSKQRFSLKLAPATYRMVLPCNRIGDLRVPPIGFLQRI